MARDSLLSRALLSFIISSVFGNPIDLVECFLKAPPYVTINDEGLILASASADAPCGLQCSSCRISTSFKRAKNDSVLYAREILDFTHKVPALRILHYSHRASLL